MGRNRELCGFSLGTSAFDGLECWKSRPFDIDFVLNPADPELLDFWKISYPKLYEFLITPGQRMMLWDAPMDKALIVKLMEYGT